MISHKRWIVAATVVVVILAALFAGSILLQNNALKIDEVHWQGNPMPPCFENAAQCGGHALGADENGRDEFARLVVGGWVTLGISFLAVVIGLTIAVVLGVAMRYGGAIMRFSIMRVADAITCFPAWPFLLVLVLAAFTRPNRFAPSWWGLAILLAVLSWPQMTRLALVAVGYGSLLNQAARNWRNAILIFSTIEFLGYGIQPPTPSWGNMLANAEATLQDQWWAAVLPGLCIFFAVFLIEIGRRAVFGTSTAERLPASSNATAA
jgi:peptide/nickel transport system permease protein